MILRGNCAIAVISQNLQNCYPEVSLDHPLRSETWYLSSVES